MSRSMLALFVGLAALLALAYWFYLGKIAVTHIDYLGMRFDLPRAYASYEAFRDDPNNLGPTNLARIQAMAETHRLPEVFASTEAFGKQAFELKVPGYGLANLRVDAPDPKPMLIAVEIPGTVRWRFLLAAGEPGSVRVIDDFIHEGKPITSAVVQSGVVHYIGPQGSVRELPR